MMLVHHQELAMTLKHTSLRQAAAMHFSHVLGLQMHNLCLVTELNPKRA